MRTNVMTAIPDLPGHLIARGQYMFTEKYMTAMKNWSDRSKEQRIDWVADFIHGDGNSFDFGIDYHYCPCLAYFSSRDAKEIAPYFCLVDFPEHSLMETGLMRTQTLAQGNDVCDFRYKKGRRSPRTGQRRFKNLMDSYG